MSFHPWYDVALFCLWWKSIEVEFHGVCGLEVVTVRYSYLEGVTGGLLIGTGGVCGEKDACSPGVCYSKILEVITCRSLHIVDGLGRDIAL